VAADQTARLYLKPDDRWEQNEVATRLPEVSEALAETLAGWLAVAAAGTPGQQPPLPEMLQETGRGGP